MEALGAASERLAAALGGRACRERSRTYSSLTYLFTSVMLMIEGLPMYSRGLERGIGRGDTPERAVAGGGGGLDHAPVYCNE